MSNALNRKSSGTPVGLSAEIFTEILSKIAGVYVLLMAGVFPLFLRDKYYDVLNEKFYFFFYVTVAAAGVSLVVLGIGILGGALRKQKNGARPLAEIFRLSLTDILFLVFVAVASVSTLASEWVYEAFWGNNGRLQGLFFYLVMLFAWFMITRFFRFRPSHLYVLLAAGMLVCLWGITDYFGMDIFGFRADANDYKGMLIFTSSIGNVDTYSAVAAIYFGMSACLSLGEKKYGLFMACFFVSAMALIMGTADNAVLSAGGLLALLPFYALQDRKRIGKCLLLPALFAAAMAVTGFLTPVWTATPVLPESSRGILLEISVAVPGIPAVISLLLAAGGILLHRSAEKCREYRPGPLLIAWGALCAAGLLAVVFLFADANTAKLLTLPEKIRGFFEFSDSWGTNRGYAWRKTVEFFKEFSLFKKLFGSGPETYGIFMEQRYFYDMIDFMDAVFDSPHSEPLQYLFTTGILGFAAFYSMMVTGILKGIRKGGVAAACAFAAVAYIFASLINISVPVSTPLLFLVLALAESVKENEDQV